MAKSGQIRKRHLGTDFLDSPWETTPSLRREWGVEGKVGERDEGRQRKLELVCKIKKQQLKYKYLKFKKRKRCLKVTGNSRAVPMPDSYRLSLRSPVCAVANWF